jgi:signal transduction histidine kinase
MRDTYDQNVIVDVDVKLIPELESSKQTIIFYIAEEAVNNARKYAQAAHIWVRLKDIGSQIAMLEIQDDGVGFNLGGCYV